MSPFWVTVSLPTPLLSGLFDNGLQSARWRLVKATLPGSDFHKILCQRPFEPEGEFSSLIYSSAAQVSTKSWY